MPLLHRMGTSLTVALLTTLLLWALGSSGGVQATDAATRPGSATSGQARPDPLGVAVPSSWRPGFVPAVHAGERSVHRPVPRTAAPTSGTTVSDIPATALAAYQRAATVLADAAPTCRLPWTLLAGIGRVESDHGRFHGARLDAQGVSHPRVIGVALDGAGPVAAVRDTDGGSLDGDPTWDRAVGPLQFIPATWATVGVDADGDGRRSPDDIDDAALAAGVYLCAGTSDLDVADRARAALLRFNHSSSYAALVLAYAESYRTDSTEPLTHLISPAPVASLVVAARRLPPHGPAAMATAIRSEHAAEDAHAAPGHAGQAAHGHQPAGTPSAHPAKGSGHGQGPAAPPGDPVPPGDPATPGDPGAPDEPAPPAPEDPPATDDPEPPAPSEPPTEEPAPAPEPQVVEGTWTACAAGSCLDGRPLDLAGADPTCQAADYDGDGGTEPLEAEVAGLRDQVVSVTVLAEPVGWLLLEVHGLAWPSADAGCPSGAAGDPEATEPGAGS